MLRSRGGERTIENADDIAPLLDVHSRRGELSEVIKIFNGIEETYGVQPSIKCWNILINAYGKVLISMELSLNFKGCSLLRFSRTATHTVL